MGKNERYKEDLGMSRSFLIASGKGGVGKSTIAVSLAQALAARGLSVALMDADTGLRCMDLMLNMQDKVVYDFADVLDKRCTLQEAMYRVPGNGQLYLLSASQILRAAEIRPKGVLKVTQALNRMYDVVILDCPAGLGRNLKVNLGSVDEYILVATPDDIAIRDVERMGQLLREYTMDHPKIIFNRVDARMVRRGEMISPQDAALMLDMPLCGVVPDSDMVYRGLLRHKTAYDCGDKKVKAAFERIAKRLLGGDEPIKEEKPSPVEKFFLRPRM